MQQLLLNWFTLMIGNIITVIYCNETPVDSILRIRTVDNF